MASRITWWPSGRGCDLDEFVVSDDLCTVALLWNINGCSELQILEYADKTLFDPIPLPGLVASELSISAGGSMVAVTVEGPSLPPTVELVDPRHGMAAHRSRAEPRTGGHRLSVGPTLETITARDGLTSPAGCTGRRPASQTIGALVFLHGGPEGQCRPGYNEFFPGLLERGNHACSRRMSGARAGSGAPSCTPTTKNGGSPRSTTSRDACGFSSTTVAPIPDRIACCGLVLRRVSDAGGADFSSGRCSPPASASAA